jgi:hypothetical protein
MAAASHERPKSRAPEALKRFFPGHNLTRKPGTTHINTASKAHHSAAGSSMALARIPRRRRTIFCQIGGTKPRIGH